MLQIHFLKTNYGNNIKYTINININNFIFYYQKFNDKNERLEDFITKQSEAVNECNRRLLEIDDKGIFYADDSIGWFFGEVKKIQEALNEFTLK